MMMLQLVLFVMSIVFTADSVPNCTGYQYELKFKRTENGNVITMWCRNGLTAEKIDITKAQFWLNWTAVNDIDLRRRTDIHVLFLEDVANNHLKFLLNRNLEGSYTCGEKDIAQQSTPKQLICKYRLRCYLCT